jgi:hypothetical protein
MLALLLKLTLRMNRPVSYGSGVTNSRMIVWSNGSENAS